ALRGPFFVTSTERYGCRRTRHEVPGPHAIIGDPFVVPMPMPRELVVTCALPYPNGPLHLGHLVGYVQGDIFARAQRLSGHAAHFVCADDTHGTPIMLAAEKAGMTPETYIAGIQASHERDFADFGVADRKSV